MMVDAVVVERADKLQVFSPRLSRGLPIHTLDLKHKGKKIKLSSSIDEIDADLNSMGCKCSNFHVNTTKVAKETVRSTPVGRGVCINCGCCDVIYIVVPEVFLK